MATCSATPNKSLLAHLSLVSRYCLSMCQTVDYFGIAVEGSNVGERFHSRMSTVVGGTVLGHKSFHFHKFEDYL
jgi:hypothetical protein